MKIFHRLTEPTDEPYLITDIKEVSNFSRIRNILTDDLVCPHLLVAFHLMYDTKKTFVGFPKITRWTKEKTEETIKAWKESVEDHLARNKRRPAIILK